MNCHLINTTRITTASRRYGRAVIDPRNNDIYINGTVQFPLYTQLKTTYRNNFRYVVMTSWDVDDILSAR